MELEGSLQCSQEPITGPRPRPDESSFLTLRERVLDKLTVTQLLKNSPSFMEP